MDDAILLKHNEKIPRYTSYPTAPHFTAAVGPDAYAQWLSALDRGSSLSLYIHIPFCRSLCLFCGCQMTVVNGAAPIERYLTLLHRELDLVALSLGPARPVSHVHFGGGTPTVLTESNLMALADALCARFDIGDDAEIAVEIDPRTLSPSLARALANAGVNRASLGVQDFDPTVQRAVNRVHPYEQVKAAVDSLHDHGITAISMDLMYGLPHQSIETMAATVDSVIRLAPSRVSLFGYAHVPWMKKHQALIDESALPDAAARLALQRTAAQHLVAAGYFAVGLDHFARPGDDLAVAARTGKLARNFQGYTTDRAAALIGLGASAIGSLPQGYIQNTASVSAYAKAIEAGRLATARGVRVTREDELRREVITRLMCDLRVDLGETAARFGADASMFDDSVAALKPLAADGLVRIEDRRITVPEDARLAVRSVCAAFDHYLAPGTERHSQAI